MKKSFVLAFIICLFGNFASAQEILDVLSDETCECLKKKDLKDAPSSEIENALAMCFVQIAPPHLEAIEKQMGINLMNGEEEGRKLGEKIGIKLVTTCPAFMELMGAFMEEDLDEGGTASMGNLIEGKLVKIESDQFASLIIKEDGSGKEHRLLWITDFDNADRLVADGKKAFGKQVIVQYEELEVYQPKTKTYKAMKVVVGMEME